MPETTEAALCGCPGATRCGSAMWHVHPAGCSSCRRMIRTAYIRAGQHLCGPCYRNEKTAPAAREGAADS
jgi:hypothetical protein